MTHPKEALASRRTAASAVTAIETSTIQMEKLGLLGELLGYNRYEALGRLCHLWNLCGRRSSAVVSVAEADEFLGTGGADALLAIDLAVQFPGGIRLRGSLLDRSHH